MLEGTPSGGPGFLKEPTHVLYDRTGSSAEHAGYGPPMDTTSFWITQQEPPCLSPLTEDVRADTCIVGGGIAGLTTAWLLEKAGKSVVVLEDGAVGGGMTGRTTAHLSYALDDRISEVERMHGTEGARLGVEAHSAAIDMVERIVREEAIECDFERLDGYLFGDEQVLEEERDAAARVGLAAVRLVDRVPLPSHDTGRALLFPRVAQFQPMLYLEGLSRALQRNGVKIFTGTHATEITRGRVGTANGPAVLAPTVVVATNTPVHTRVVMHTKQHPYNTYVIAGRVPAGSVPHLLLWDTEDPYHYVRLARTGDPAFEMLIVGGEDHKTGEADDGGERFQRLESWTRARFPEMTEVVHRWSGEVMEPVDGLGFAGETPGQKDVYLITGDSGQGMTHGTLGAMIVRDLVTGRANPWARVHDPSRKPASKDSLLEYVKENLDLGVQYGRWLAPGEVKSADEILPGQGAVLRRAGVPVAAYRRPDGTLVEMSAVCRHLGCIVSWNSTEKTWDCPCHGSRYEAEGRVVMGPANEDLKPR